MRFPVMSGCNLEPVGEDNHIRLTWYFTNTFFIPLICPVFLQSSVTNYIHSFQKRRPLIHLTVWVFNLLGMLLGSVDFKFYIYPSLTLKISYCAFFIFSSIWCCKIPPMEWERKSVFDYIILVPFLQLLVQLRF